MLLGSHSITMDAKGRLAVPAKLRDTLAATCGGRVVITADTQERCLIIYPEPVWQELVPKIQALPNIDRKAKRIQRLLLGHATPLEIDEATGRVLLSPTLRDYAGLKKKIRLVGQSNKIEIWAEDAWDEYLEDESDDTGASDALSSISL